MCCVGDAGDVGYVGVGVDVCMYVVGLADGVGCVGALIGVAGVYVDVIVVGCIIGGGCGLVDVVGVVVAGVELDVWCDVVVDGVAIG